MSNWFTGFWPAGGVLLSKNPGQAGQKLQVEKYRVEIFIIAYARTIDYLKVFGIYGGCCEVLVDERANSDSSDDDVASMRVTIFLTLDRAGRVKAEVKEVVHKAGCRSHGMRHQRDSGYRVDTQRGERRPHTHSVGAAHVKRRVYTLTAVSGEYEAEKGIYKACDDVADQNSPGRCDND
jgi:hypothetical protein